MNKTARGSIAHPDLLTKLSATFYASTCTIQEATETPNDYNEPIASWSAVSGLANVACAIAPAVPFSVLGDRETSRPLAEVTTDQYWISFPAYYTQITTKMRVLASDGSTVYDILAVDHDSQGVMTRLSAKKVST